MKTFKMKNSEEDLLAYRLCARIRAALWGFMHLHPSLSSASPSLVLIVFSPTSSHPRALVLAVPPARNSFFQIFWQLAPISTSGLSSDVPSQRGLSSPLNPMWPCRVPLLHRLSYSLCSPIKLFQCFVWAFFLLLSHGL